MKPLRCLIPTLSLALLIPATSLWGAPPPKVSSATTGTVPKKGGKSKLAAAFAKKMTNATLVGSFTVDGKGAGKPPKPERYELGKVRHLAGDSWLWIAKIQYGGKKGSKVSFPIPLTIKWAGDTPVITMTNFSIPGMGTFTSRVLFYGDRYVGTWQHGKVGGHMYGKIELAKKPKGKTATKASK